jgi:hypothetical protein
MEEIVFIFSTLAGACTAVALDKIPRIKRNKQVSSINPAITSQLNSLRLEKEILSKTITRIHQRELNDVGIQKEKLLLRYQHQLEIVTTKMEKLETAIHPDFGPVGDSLISFMDNRLSQLDQKLYEISSKITATQTKKVAERSNEIILQDIQTKKIEPQIEIQKEKIEVVEKRETVEEITLEGLHPTTEVSPHKIHGIIEPSTAIIETKNIIPQFPVELTRTKVEAEIPKKSTGPLMIEEPVAHKFNIQDTKEETIIKLPEPEVIQQEQERKIQLPVAIKIPEEEKLYDDDKDLDKIKSEIMKALSKLEQVEVE